MLSLMDSGDGNISILDGDDGVQSMHFHFRRGSFTCFVPTTAPVETASLLNGYTVLPQGGKITAVAVVEYGISGIRIVYEV